MNEFLHVIEINRKRMLIDGENIDNEIKDDILENFNKSCSSFKKIKINGEVREVMIVEKSSLDDNPDKKRILCKPNENLNVGDVIEWNDKFWLCTEIDEDKTIYARGNIELCNGEISWQDEDFNILTTPCISTNGTLYSDGKKDTDIIAYKDDLLRVTITNNINTYKIDTNNRFIFLHDKREVYKVTSPDRKTHPGIIHLIMKHDEKQPDDNLELNVTNYKSNTPTPPSPSTSYSIEIEGNNNCIIDYEEQYKAIVKLDGSEINDKTVVWSFESVDGGNIQVTKLDGFKCTIKGLEYGNINLIATLSDDKTVLCKKQIFIRNLF